MTRRGVDLGITTKLTLVLAAAGLVLFGVFGIYMVRVEETELQRAIEREMTLVTRALQLAVEKALLVDDREALTRVMERSTGQRLIDPVITVAVFDPVGDLMAVAGPEAAALTSLVGSSETSDVVALRDDAGVRDRVIRIVPLDLGAPEGPGSMVIARPLTDVESELARTRRDIVLTVLLFVIVSTALGSLLGSLLVTRPLARLRGALRRVQLGDLASELPASRGRDEVDLLTDEFNRMVEALREARSRLDCEVEARRDLHRSVQQAEKLITIGQLSAGLAHEIGSPLQVLGGRARQLAGRADLPDDARRHAEIIAGQTERITRVVDQLVSYSRRRPPRFQELDPATTMEELVAFLEFDARRRDVALSCRAEADLPKLVTDPDQLQQILFNLVTNALQATPAGGEVQVEAGRASTANGGEGVVISVRDTGCGITADDRQRLFEPFFTTRSGDGGVGLGLAVVRTLVQEHGGRIDLDTAPGEGCLVRIELPRVHPAVAGGLT